MQRFEVREGMEGEHTPETNFTRRHQSLEEGDRFESSGEIRKMFSDSLEGRHTCSELCGRN